MAKWFVERNVISHSPGSTQIHPRGKLAISPCSGVWNRSWGFGLNGVRCKMGSAWSFLLWRTSGTKADLDCLLQQSLWERVVGGFREKRRGIQKSWRKMPFVLDTSPIQKSSNGQWDGRLLGASWVHWKRSSSNRGGKRIPNSFRWSDMKNLLSSLLCFFTAHDRRVYAWGWEGKEFVEHCECRRCGADWVERKER